MRNELINLMGAVAIMRGSQKAHLTARKRGDYDDADAILILSRFAERKVDEMMTDLEDYIKTGQLSIYNL